MKALDALNIVNKISSSQKGLFTSAQATSLGVDRMSLSRLAAHGHIESVVRGVFRAAGAPSPREEDVYAEWLATAAWLHSLGELKPEPITFSCPKRKQSRKASLRFLKRELSDEDVCMVAGIPTTTPKRTVLDLIDYGEDLSLVASVLRDAELADPDMDIKDEVDSRTMKCGFGEDFGLYAFLRKE